MKILEMTKRVEDEWLVFGDRCSKYFHQFVRAKRNQNVISEIQTMKESNTKV